LGAVRTVRIYEKNIPNIGMADPLTAAPMVARMMRIDGLLYGSNFLNPEVSAALATTPSNTFYNSSSLASIFVFISISSAGLVAIGSTFSGTCLASRS
jgi:hypothetical protein